MFARPRRRALLFLLRATSTLSSTGSCSESLAPQSYTLLAKRRLSPDSFLLHFSFGRRILGDDPALPTCIKVVFPNGTDAKTGAPRSLEKSYSPVSHPATEGVLDLVVKSYPPRPGGGVGSYLCELEPGQAMSATLKSQRLMHGDASVSRRWANLGLVGGGTGIAPLLQIARIVLDDPEDTSRVSILSINRREEDILAREELERLAAAHPGRLSLSFSLTSPPAGWGGHAGRGSLAMVRDALPPPTGDGTTQILVCGTDGFVATWGGPVGRAPPLPDGSKGPKVQGPLLGLLADAGFVASEVFKY